VGAPEAVLSRLTEARRVILTTHINADGDGAGAEVALSRFLRDRGALVHVINPTPFPRIFRFLLEEGDDELILDVSSDAAAEACRKADLAVVIDTGEVPRIGRVDELITGLPKVVVDHHEPGADAIEAVVELRDPTASAAGELVYEVIEAAGGPWPSQIVDALYVALVTDTGGFRFSNATSRSFLVASRLVALGARPEVLYNQVFGSFRINRYRLLEAALSTLTMAHGDRVAWMVVPSDAYGATSASPEDLEGFVDVPRRLIGVEIALLFRVTSRGKVKVSFRSRGEADVNVLAAHFRGGGHRKAAGALVEGELDDVVEQVVAAAGRALGGEPRAS
jgi:phosphoesterase RecJ-like protein